MELQTQIEEFETAGIAVVGISVDAPEDLKPFKERLQLTFPLLSDSARSVIQAYDVYHDSNNIAYPGTFVIDGDGIIRWKYVRTQKDDRPPTATVLEQAKLADGKK